MSTPVEQLKDFVQVGKIKRQRPLMLFNPKKEACLQNVDQKEFWQTGDPNQETTAEYDFVWVLWILRKVFPKDIVTHFVRVNGGFSFSTHSSSVSNDKTLYLSFWSDMYMLSNSQRIIYFNIPPHKIVKKKDKVYIYHHNKKNHWIS